MQDFQKLISGVTTFGQLYGLLNNSMDALRSQFSGVQFPENPTVGQPCYRTDMTPPRMFQFNGSAWVDFAAASPGVAALATEVTTARGSAVSLNARMSVALNPDGTLKGDAPASDWWNPEPDDIARVSDTAFSVAGDKRQIYTPRRALLITFDEDVTISTWVQASAYDADADRTQVTVSQGTISATPLAVEFGQPVGNEPRIGLATDTDPGLTRAIKDTEAQAGALDPALFGLPYITLSAFNIMVQKALAPSFRGRIDLLPFRNTELPFGWYFCNGDQYPLTSDQGKALSAFSTVYKSDWGITVSAGYISLPNMFYTDGRGFFVRAVDGALRQVGNTQQDQLQGHRHAYMRTLAAIGGGSQPIIYPEAESTTNALIRGVATDPNFGNARFGTETAVLNTGMTPALCLGV